MKNKNVKSEIKREQLLSERVFISYCNHDEASNHTTTRLSIDQQFLKAAEKDGFIKPLLKIEELVKQNDGTEKLEMVSYYSPFQIYLVLELSKNIIDENDYLRSPFSLDWQKEKNFRWVNWGRGMSLTIDKKRRWERNPKFASENLPLFCDYFHRFLAFIHTFELKPDHIREIEERRFFSRLSSSAYSLEHLEDNGLKLLKSHKLDTKILNLIRKEVAELATMIDPLEHWYYYVKRHTQFKKDLLKGDAALAQELYRIYDLLTSIVETIIGKESKPLFEFLYQNSPRPFLIPKVEYQSGEDVKALQFSIQQFKKWKLKKGSKPFVSSEVIKKLTIIEQQLNEFEKRYKDRIYIGGTIETENEEISELDKLDAVTKRYAEMTLKQEMAHKKLESPTIGMLKTHISLAIYSRLSDLQRELERVFRDISQQFSDKENVAWQKERDFGNNFWGKDRDKLQNLSRKEQIELASKEREKIVKEAKNWEEKSKDFHKTVFWHTGLVFCKVCRKNPIQLHIENTNLNIWETSRLNLCDICSDKISRESLDITEEGWKKIKEGEWKCEYCGKRTLYKFIQKNSFSLWTKHKVPIKVEIKYGNAVLSAKCPNCHQINQRPIVWGWLP